MTCGALRRDYYVGALRRDYYVGAEGIRRFLKQVDSCQGGELGNGIVILRVSRQIWINL